MFFFIGSYILLTFGFNFPDYDSYNAYVIKGSGLFRFIKEPVSALLLQLISYLNLDVIFYFYIVWVGYFFSCVKVIRFLKDDFIKFFFLLFLLFNPLSLLLYQTPRFLLAISFLYIAFLYIKKSNKKTFFYILLCFLSHNFLGALAFAFIVLRYLYFSKISLYLFFSIVYILLFFIIAYVIVQYFPLYFNHNVYDRGVGRYLYTFFSVLIVSILAFKRPKDLMFNVFCLVMFTYLMYLTPYFHRLSSVVLFMVFYLLLNNKTSLYYKSIISTFFISSVFFSIFIIYFGLYSYGPSFS